MTFFDHLRSLGCLEDVETLGPKDLQYITGEEQFPLDCYFESRRK